MKILLVSKYPPIQGGVSADAYWMAQTMVEMGHQVHVVTNAEEVEKEYRIDLTEKDRSLLHGYRVSNSITISQTYVDKRHIYVPQNNPSVSKMVSLGLDAIAEFNPDVIWSYYVEPYGVAALFLSKLTGIPFVIRHAGSDIGRLMQTKQLQTLYENVFRNALFVLTRSEHFDRFRNIGVLEGNLLEGFTSRLPGDLFFPLKKQNNSEFTLGIYGKVGKSKGTYVLLDTLASLKQEGFSLKLKAHWGGRDIAAVRQYAESLSLLDMISIHGFIPHWNIPNFIHSCDAILFLENQFSISFHSPGIPLEVNTCGRYLITSTEIAEKRSISSFLRQGVNCTVVPSSPLTQSSIAIAIKDAAASNYADVVNDELWLDSSLLSLRSRLRASDVFNKIMARL